MNEDELKRLNDSIQSQFLIEKTISDFDKYKSLKNDIIDIQAKIIDKQKQTQKKGQVLSSKEGKH